MVVLKLDTCTCDLKSSNITVSYISPARVHRRTSKGVGGYRLQPPQTWAVIIFRAKAKFLWQKPEAKIKDNIFCVY